MPFLNPKLGIDSSDYIAKYTQDFTGRTWVFETIRDWWADSNGERFFLLTGEPGSGKTAIAARLAQFAQGVETFPGLATGFLQAVHFCSARDSIWIDPKEFARSLALQLAASIPEFGLALKDIGEKTTNITVEQSFGTVQNSDVAGVVIKNLTISGLTGQEAFTQVVVNPLRQIQQDGFSQPVTLLVDSLDEALTHSGGTTIVGLLEKLSSSVKIRFILTSRNEGKVKDKLLPYEELFLSIPEHLEQNQRDVRDYIHLRLNQEETLRLQAESGDRDSLITTLTDKSEGNFLYIRFLLDAVVSGQQNLTNPAGLPQGLDELYSTSLRRVVELGNQDWIAVYAPVMGVLLAAQESLRLSQIQVLTQLKKSVVWNALTDLGQFLDEIESEEGETLYRLYHQSVADFLGKQQLLIDKNKLRNRYYLPAEEQHQRFIDYYRPEGQPWSEVNLEQIDGYGRRYLPQHLVKAGQVQELHLLLALEKDGKPAWFKLKDDEGDTAGFLADLELAWAQADEAYNCERGKSIGLQCRYALIKASINSLAEIPLTLTLALIKHQHWQPIKVFTYALPEIASRWYPECDRSLTLGTTPHLQVLRDATADCWLAAWPIPDTDSPLVPDAYWSELAIDPAAVRHDLTQPEQEALMAEVLHLQLGQQLGYPWLKPTLDAALSAVASLMLRRTAARLPRFHRSSPAYLSRQFLSQPAALYPGPETLTIRLSGGPLSMVLKMASLPETLTVPWLSQPLQFTLPGGLS